MPKSLKIYRWRGRGSAHGNFGDEITIPLLDTLFGIKAIPVRMRDAELIGAGSILDSWVLRGGWQYLKNAFPIGQSKELHVWGSGFILPDTAAKWPQKLIIHALRGELSAQRAGHGAVLGDPGILASRLLSRLPSKAAAVGIVPHHADFTIFERHELPASWVLIDPSAPVNHVVHRIAECDLVVSSSLHGLIAADAFGIPCVRISSDRPLFGSSDFKFRDYESARRRPFNSILTYAEIIQYAPERISDISNVSARSIEEWQREIIDSFPFPYSS